MARTYNRIGSPKDGELYFERLGDKLLCDVLGDFGRIIRDPKLPYLKNYLEAHRDIILELGPTKLELEAALGIYPSRTYIAKKVQDICQYIKGRKYADSDIRAHADKVIEDLKREVAELEEKARNNGIAKKTWNPTLNKN